MANGKNKNVRVISQEPASKMKKLKFYFSPERSLEYFGVVNYATNERVISDIKEKMIGNHEPIILTITSPGGPTGTAMSFFDQVRYVLKPNLVTVASGDVDSSGIILFLAGNERFVTPHTTLLFHIAGRTLVNNRRFTVTDMDAMLREDNIKDHQYASLVAGCSRGRLSADKVLNMMKKNTLCTPEELVAYGLADSVLE